MNLSETQYEKLKTSFSNGRGYRLRYSNKDVEKLDENAFNDKVNKRILMAKQNGSGIDMNLNNEDLKEILDKLDTKDEHNSSKLTQSHRLGHKILNSDLSNKLAKSLYNSVIVPQLELKKSANIPKYDEKMKNFMIVLLSNSEDFVKLVNADLDERQTKRIVKILTTELKGQSGEGFLNDVKDKLYAGIKKVYTVVKTVGNSIVNVIDNTGTQFVEKLNNRYNTPEGLAKFTGTLATEAISSVATGNIEALPVVIVSDIAENLLEDLGKSFLSALGAEINKKNNPSITPNITSPNPVSNIQNEVVDNAEDEAGQVLVGSGARNTNLYKLINEILSK